MALGQGIGIHLRLLRAPEPAHIFLWCESWPDFDLLPDTFQALEQEGRTDRILLTFRLAVWIQVLRDQECAGRLQYPRQSSPD